MYRSFFALTTALAVAGCSDPQTVEAQRTDAQPVISPALGASEEDRRRASRVAQLQTPLERRPEDTGAPAPSFRGTNLDVDRQDLVAAGVNVNPSVRVWTRQPDGRGRQVYGVRAPFGSDLAKPVGLGPEPTPVVPTTPPPPS